MASYQYSVVSDERWDNIAQKAYGDPGKIEGIISANLNVPIDGVIPAGTVLEIPVLPELSAETPAQLLPPWLI